MQTRYNPHTEVRGHPWVSILDFRLIGAVCCCIVEVSRPTVFQEFSCLHFSSHSRRTKPAGWLYVRTDKPVLLLVRQLWSSWSHLASLKMSFLNLYTPPPPHTHSLSGVLKCLLLRLPLTSSQSNLCACSSQNILSFLL